MSHSPQDVHKKLLGKKGERTPESNSFDGKFLKIPKKLFSKSFFGGDSRGKALWRIP